MGIVFLILGVIGLFKGAWILCRGEMKLPSVMEEDDLDAYQVSKLTGKQANRAGLAVLGLGVVCLLMSLLFFSI